MKEADKKTYIRFLNLCSDFSRDGYRSTEIIIEDEDAPLPLLYLVNENDDEENLDKLSLEISHCISCHLCKSRNLSVCGEGALNPLVMVIGEGPGADEDRSGRPFVGRSGQLLDKMLSSVGLSREKNCYIANIVKCRPPGNRNPLQEEIEACMPYLKRQIKLLEPSLILCAGRIAANNLIGTNSSLDNLRGSFHEINLDDSNFPVLSTFHPSAILRDESLKRPAWEDLKLLRSRLEEMGHALALL